MCLCFYPPPLLAEDKIRAVVEEGILWSWVRWKSPCLSGIGRNVFFWFYFRLSISIKVDDATVGVTISWPSRKEQSKDVLVEKRSQRPKRQEEDKKKRIRGSLN